MCGEANTTAENTEKREGRGESQSGGTDGEGSEVVERMEREEGDSHRLKAEERKLGAMVALLRLSFLTSAH